MSKLPPRELVQELLEYDPVAGLLRWKLRPNGYPYWNAKYAGTIAGRSNGQTNWVYINSKIYPVASICWLHYYGEPVPKFVNHIDFDNTNNRPGNWIGSKVQRHKSKTA